MKKMIAIIGFFGVFASFVGDAYAAYFTNRPIVRCQTQITKDLKVGSENADVLVLQQLLANAGFLNAAPNGYFGYQTKAALRSFQANNGIPATGTVGEMTRNAINERLCDNDLIDNTVSYQGMYGQYVSNTSITYVGNEDPFVKVVVPPSTTPAIYATAQTISPTIANASFSPVSPSIATSYAPNQAQVTGQSIVYSQSAGYTYGLSQSGGAITISSPIVNSIYREGETIVINWTTENISGPFTVLLENASTNQSRIVGITPGNTYSMVLTKDLLDALCNGSCTSSSIQNDSFRVVVTVPTTDIAGRTSNLRVTVAPVVIKRPSPLGTLSLTVSPVPVASGETMRLYVNTPSGNIMGADTANYTLTITALCPSSVTVNLAGASCGQDIVVPFNVIATQNGIPVRITNPTWYAQNVTFQVTLRDQAGQIIATASAVGTVSKAAFSW